MSQAQWNEVAQRINDISGAPTTLHYFRREKHIFEKYFPAGKKKRLLKSDLWNEVNNTKLLQWACKYYGCSAFDISSYLVKKARKDASLKARIVECDARDLKFPDSYFDYVYSMGTIEHFDGTEKAISEFNRVMKKGGIIVLGIPLKYDFFLTRVFVTVLSWVNLYPYAPEKSYSRGQLKKMVEERGFKVKEMHTILFMPILFRALDIWFYKRFQPGLFFTRPVLSILAFFEEKTWIGRNLGYLLYCVAEKTENVVE